MNFFGSLSAQSGETNSSMSFEREDLPSELLIYRYCKLIEKEEIGKGGFASVFTAKTPGAQKIVVKKAHPCKKVADKRSKIIGRPKACKRRRIKGSMSRCMRSIAWTCQLWLSTHWMWHTKYQSGRLSLGMRTIKLPRDECCSPCPCCIRHRHWFRISPQSWRDTPWP